MSSVSQAGVLTASSASVGTAFVGVVALVLDLFIGVPLEHVLALALFASILYESHRNSLFNQKEVALFAAVLLSLLVIIVLTFSSPFVTFGADAMLFGHAALQIHLHIGKAFSSLIASVIYLNQPTGTGAGAWLVMSLVLLFDLLLSATVRSFPTFVSQAVLMCSCALGGSFLACLVLGNASARDVAHDWVKVSLPNIEESVEKPSAPIEDEPTTCRIPDLTQEDASNPALARSQDEDASLNSREEEHENLDELQTNIKKRKDMSKRISSGVQKACGGAKGFLDKFVLHKTEMGWLEAKGRLLSGSMLLKRTGKTSSTSRRRFVRLNDVSAMLEWWRPDHSKLVGQSRIEDLQEVFSGTISSRNQNSDPEMSALPLDCNLKVKRTISVLFSSRSIEFEAETVEAAAVWCADMQLLLEHKMTFKA